jgi:tetratricopeptide (TPR) repeat protein
MAMDHLARYEKLIAAANEYHAKGSWQEKLNALQQAIVETQAPGFPNDDKYRYTTRFELGTVYRRFGQFERAEHEYQSLLDEFPTADPTFQASVFGKLIAIRLSVGTQS